MVFQRQLPEQRETQNKHEHLGVVQAERRKRGRPPGAKNKAKSILPAEIASEVLVAMKETLPPEQYEYVKGVIRDGKAISTEREVEIMMLMLARTLLPAMVAETRPPVNDLPPEIAAEIGAGPAIPEFRKDVTERIKAFTALANLKLNIEKGRRSDEPDNSKKPILEIFARSGLDAGRIGILIGAIPDPVGAGYRAVGKQADSPRAISDQVPERPLLLPDSQQIEANGDVNGSSSRDDPFRLREEQL